MYLDRMHRRLGELAELGALEAADVVPCTEEELLALEQQLGLRLPGAAREFYLWGGKDFGSVFGGMDVLGLGEHMEHDYRPGARETLEQAGEDSALLTVQALIFQMDCDGQFSFIVAGEEQDPPVYTHNEQEPTFRSCERLSDYLALMVEQSAGIEEVHLIRSPEDLNHLPRPGQSSPYLEVRHLHFSGEVHFPTIPDQVFEFTELRSLNLVGKGLIELSPRVAELAFLKRLDLARNSLSSLPMALTQLDELEDLDLADNQMSTVIGVLRKLPGLRYCALTGNPLSAEESNGLRTEMPHVAFSLTTSSPQGARSR